MTWFSPLLRPTDARDGYLRIRYGIWSFLEHECADRPIELIKQKPGARLTLRKRKRNTTVR